MKRKARKPPAADIVVEGETPLLLQVKEWVGRHPGVVRESQYIARGRPWDAPLESFVGQVERLRRRFPRERVNQAWRILSRGRRPRTSREFEDTLQEQVYRAHYSSLKIQHSWEHALTATEALAHLFDVPGERTGAAPAEDGEHERIRQVWTSLWPDEKLGDLLDLLQGERFYGHIPLRTGALVLGLRLILEEYARGVVGVLRRLHRDDDYTFGLCSGRVVSWEEAMVLKALPEGAGDSAAARPRGGADAES